MLCTLTRVWSSLPAFAVQPLSHRMSVKKQWIVSQEECTRFHAKNYARVRFCRRSGPATKFLNVCENIARNVWHVKHYCPFTRSSFCNISQTFIKFCKECWVFFRRVKWAIFSSSCQNSWYLYSYSNLFLCGLRTSTLLCFLHLLLLCSFHTWLTSSLTVCLYM